MEPAVHRQLSERFIEACSGGDLEGLLALLDPAVRGTGDVVSGVLVGAPTSPRRSCVTWGRRRRRR